MSQAHFSVDYKIQSVLYEKDASIRLKFYWRPAVPRRVTCVTHTLHMTAFPLQRSSCQAEAKERANTQVVESLKSAFESANFVITGQWTSQFTVRVCRVQFNPDDILSVCLGLNDMHTGADSTTAHARTSITCARACACDQGRERAGIRHNNNTKWADK